MSDVLLIQPPIRDFYFTAKRSIPYGLISIAGSLRKAGFSVSLIDSLATSKSKTIPVPESMEYVKEFYGEQDISPFSLFHHYRYYGYSFEHIGNLVKQSGSLIIGISSLFSAYSEEALETASVVRKVCPDAVVVLGGHHPTAMPESVLRHPAVDYVILGEGEAVFPELVRALRDNRPVDSVPGVAFRKAPEVFHIPSPVILDSTESIPLPASDLVNHKFYSRKTGGSAVITASRGCPMKCSYCCVASPASRYRMRTVDSVVDEIRVAVKDYGARFIDFEDEHLTLNRDWFYSLLDRITDEFSDLNLELRAMNGLFPPSLDSDMVGRMKAAGFMALNLSLCTVDQEQLKRFNRPDVSCSVEGVLAAADLHGMESVCYIIVGAPGQHPETSVDDLIYLSGLNTIAGVSVFYPAPGSRDFIRAKERQLLPRSFGLMRSSIIPISDTTTRIESITLLRLGRILNFMKLMEKTGVTFNPEPLSDSVKILEKKRDDLGVALVNSFLHDYKIRGVNPDGSLFIHTISSPLAVRFGKAMYNRLN